MRGLIAWRRVRRCGKWCCLIKSQDGQSEVCLRSRRCICVGKLEAACPACSARKQRKIGGITMSRKLLLLLCGLMPALAQSQSVYRADAVTAQPLVYRDGGSISGCGLHVVAILSLTGSQALIYDFSLISRYFRPEDEYLAAVGKAGSQIANIESISVDGYSATSFFIGSEDGKVTAAPEKFVASETAGFVMGVFDGLVGLQLLEMMAGGQALQVGITTDSSKLTRVMSFQLSLDAVDKQTFSACMHNHLNQIKERIGTTPKQPRKK